MCICEYYVTDLKNLVCENMLTQIINSYVKRHDCNEVNSIKSNIITQHQKKGNKYPCKKSEHNR